MPTRERIFWVHDYETIKNCFVGCFLNFKTREMRTFVVHFLRNDWQEFLTFLEQCRDNHDWHFGYNSLAFDGQITQYILQNVRTFRRMTNPDDITLLLKEFANSVIAKSNAGEFLPFPEWKQQIKQHDIFKQNHWDNKAKRSSLKWIQFTMDWPNVEEMPHKHWEPVNTLEQLEEVVSYCENDVYSTDGIYNYKNRKGQKEMMEQLGLRIKLSNEYQVSLHSASETRISKEIFLTFLAPEMGLEKKDFRDMRTERLEVRGKDILLPVTFNTPDFKAVKYWFEDLVIDTAFGTEAAEKTQKGPKTSMWIKGVKTDYALGGVHGCTKPGIYRSGNGRILVSADVTSFYPMLAIMNDWHPAHIPQKIFKKIYYGFFTKRKEYPKGHFLNYLFKIILNATYGLSKNRYSFLYDPEFTFRITLNGQLLLSKLYEMVLEAIPSAQPIMQNTDGLEFLIDEKDKARYYEVCKEWEQLTKLSLEFVEYDQMIIRDVNNYIAVWTEDGKRKTKHKGAFEFEDLPLHKNKSFLVIPKALSAYFLDGIKPEEYLSSNQNFFDYCAGVKLTSGWHFEEVENRGGEILTTQHQKLLRYYISRKGTKLFKVNADGKRRSQLEAGHGGKWKQTVANQYVEKPFPEYDIDQRYYLEAIRNEISNIEGTADVVLGHTKANQLSLF